METSITHIRIFESRYGDLYWNCVLADGCGSSNIFGKYFDKLSMFNDVYNKLTTAKKGDIFELTPDIPVVVAEDAKGYRNIVHAQFIPDVVAELERSPFETPSYQRWAKKSAIDQLRSLACCEYLVVFDAETTGKDPNKDEFVSFGLCHNISKTYYYDLVKPTDAGMKRMINSGAMDIHHITPEQLEDRQSFEDFYTAIYPHLADNVWAVYNADYDVTMLDSLCQRHDLPLIPRLGVHCVMKLFAQCVHEVNDKKTGWKWHKLSDAVEMCNIELDNAHNALSDAQATYELIMASYRGVE